MVLIPRITRMASDICLDETFVSYGQNHSSRRTYPPATGDFGHFGVPLDVQMNKEVICTLYSSPWTYWYGQLLKNLQKSAQNDQNRFGNKETDFAFSWLQVNPLSLAGP